MMLAIKEPIQLETEFFLFTSSHDSTPDLTKYVVLPWTNDSGCQVLFYTIRTYLNQMQWQNKVKVIFIFSKDYLLFVLKCLKI